MQVTRMNIAKKLVCLRLRNNNSLIGMHQQRRGFSKSAPINEIDKKDHTNQPQPQQQHGEPLFKNTTEPANIPPRVFESLDFPAKFTLKIIGVEDSTFHSDMLLILSNIVESNGGRGGGEAKESSIKHISSIPTTSITKGKYMSITVTPTFNNSDEIYQCYAMLKLDTRVKFVL